MIGDWLLMRDGNRMVAMPCALQLKEPVCAALGAAAGFDAARASRTFVLLGCDYFSALRMLRLARDPANIWLRGHIARANRTRPLSPTRAQAYGCRRLEHRARRVAPEPA